MASYGEAAHEKVHSAMRRMQHGTLESGRSHRKVKSRKQAIAIGLSEAREKGAKVPARGPRTRASASSSSRSSSRSTGSRPSGRSSSGRSSRRPASSRTSSRSSSSRTSSRGSRKKK